jgi:hypothetical protein
MESTRPRRRRAYAKHLFAALGPSALIAAGVTLAGQMGEMPMTRGYAPPANPPMSLGPQATTTTSTTTTTMSMAPGMHMPGM